MTYVGACIFHENVSIETFNILFESTHNKQQYDTKITCTRGKEGKVMVITKIVTTSIGFDL